MKLNEYQEKCSKYDLYTPTSNITEQAFMDKILGLVGESGEVADKVKKIMRDNNGKAKEQDLIEIAKEIGDVLWYVAELSKYIGFSLEDIAVINLNKLESRKDRGKLCGSGDNR